MKIIFYADAHLGHYQEFDNNGSRLQRCLDAMNQMFEYASQNQVSLVVDCGDLIDRKNLIDFGTYNKIYDFFAENNFHNLVGHVSIIGNHNISSVTGATNLHPLCEYTYVITEPKVKIQNGTFLFFLPFRRNEQQWIKEYNWLCSQIIDVNAPSILVAHQEVKGAHTYNYTAENGIDLAQLPNPFTWRIFGHYHMGQQIDASSFYCGALLQQNFGECVNPQGFWVYDIEKPIWVWVPIDVPEFGIANSVDQIPLGSTNFWRVKTSDKAANTAPQPANVRVEYTPEVQEIDRLKIAGATSILEMVDAYLQEHPSQDMPLIKSLITKIGERRHE